MHCSLHMSDIVTPSRSLLKVPLCLPKLFCVIELTGRMEVGDVKLLVALLMQKGVLAFCGAGCALCALVDDSTSLELLVCECLVNEMGHHSETAHNSVHISEIVRG